MGDLIRICDGLNIRKKNERMHCPSIVISVSRSTNDDYGYEYWENEFYNFHPDLFAAKKQS